MKTLQKPTSETFFSFKDIADFEDFLHTAEWKSGQLDYVTVGGKIFTQHEFDLDGTYMSWGNKKHDTIIECNTSDRYKKGFKDAKLWLFENYGLLRNDINYWE